MKVAVVGDEDFVIGFQLGGVKLGYACTTGEEAIQNVEKVRGMDDIAVLIIQRKFADEIRGYINEWKLKKGIYPVILELPGYGDEGEYEDPMREVIRRAIGIDIMKR
jgi:V/A-type H+-transporting ATPase subunit F